MQICVCMYLTIYQITIENLDINQLSHLSSAPWRHPWGPPGDIWGLWKRPLQRAACCTSWVTAARSRESLLAQHGNTAYRAAWYRSVCFNFMCFTDIYRQMWKSVPVV